jgi:hypothetical protein
MFNFCSPELVSHADEQMYQENSSDDGDQTRFVKYDLKPWVSRSLPKKPKTYTAEPFAAQKSPQIPLNKT